MYLHVTAPRHAERDERVPDELHDLPRRVDALVLHLVIVHANVADELGPCGAVWDVGVELDACHN